MVLDCSPLPGSFCVILSSDENAQGSGGGNKPRKLQEQVSVRGSLVSAVSASIASEDGNK